MVTSNSSLSVENKSPLTKAAPSSQVKIGVAALDGDTSSMISPIPKGRAGVSSSGYQNMSMPTNSKLVDDSFG